MINLLNWQINLSSPVVGIVSVLLLISLLISLRAVFKRLYQRSARLALLTMLLNLVAYLAVLIILLEPVHRRQAEETVILLTEGAKSGSITSQSRSTTYLAPGADVAGRNGQLPARVKKLGVIEQLALKEPALSKIEVHGYGLRESQWRGLRPDIPIVFEAPTVTGFTDMQWNRSLVSGEDLDISGFYQPPSKKAIVTVRLIDPGGDIIAEQRLLAGEPFNFSVSTKARGKLKYQLQAWVAEQLLIEQPVTVFIRPGELWNIMIRQSAPSFEARQLKNYATALGHQLVVLTDISKDKALQQTGNLPVNSEIGFSPQTLARQDVLIMDGRAVSQLNATRQQWLLDAVENGLGLLILADTALLQEFETLQKDLLEGFALTPLPDADIEVMPRLLNGDDQPWLSPLSVQAMDLTADGAEILIDDNFGRSLFTYRPKGLGTIAISLVTHSDRWLTSGNRVYFGELWSAMFAAISRQPDTNRLLSQDDNRFYRAGKKISICALTGDGDLHVLLKPTGQLEQSDTHKLSLAEDELDSPRQCAYAWPQNPGWQQIELRHDSDERIIDQTAVYVFQTDQWQAQQRNSRVRATNARAALTQGLTPSEAQKWISEPVKTFWPWFLLVLSASLLWLERKLDELTKP